MQGIKHTIRRLIGASLSDGVGRTHNSYIATLLYKLERLQSTKLIVPNAPYRAYAWTTD